MSTTVEQEDRTDFTDLPDVLHNAGKPAAWVTEDEDGEENRTAVFIRGSYDADADHVRVLCQRKEEDALLDTAWERVEVLA